MLDYNPLHHPFELPVQKLRVHCVTDRPLFFPAHSGSTPGTTLSGAFGSALWEAVCLNHCQTSSKEPQCQHPEKCKVPWLYKPYSKIHCRNFARPVLLRAIALEESEPVEVFILEVTLWGRHAIAALHDVTKTLHKMGELGLKAENKVVHFQITKIETQPSISLAQRIQTLPLAHSVLLEFQTPFLHQEKNKEGKRQFYLDQSLPIVNILGNAAYNLVAWDIEDRGLLLDRAMRHNLARDARDVARDSAKEILHQRSHLSSVDIGTRYSRSNQQEMSLQGFVGLVELTGNIKSSLPWLLVLTLAGGGQKRAMGFGTVRLWLDGDL